MDRFLFIGLLSIIAWVPLPFGSNRGWASGIYCSAMFLLASGWVVLYAHEKVKCTLPFLRALPCVGLLAFMAIFAFCQTVPISLDWLDVIAKKSVNVYRGCINAGIDCMPSISIDSYHTRLKTIQLLAHLILFCLVLLLVNTNFRVKTLAYTIIIGGVFQACYGSFMVLSGLEYSFFVQKEELRGLTTGTFTNRNHLAGYLEMSLAVGIGILIGSSSGPLLRDWQDWLSFAARFLLSEKAPVRISIIVMAIALVLTRSRMGNIAFLSSLTTTFIFYSIFARRHFRARTIALWASILLIDISIIGGYFGVEKLAQRIEQTTTKEVASRVDLFDYALPYAKTYQPFGSGLGTFYTAFPPHSGPEVKSFFDHAHNDYLEFFGELGVFSIVLLVAVILSTATAFQALKLHHDMLSTGISFAAIMGITSLLIHSTVDFNLQIPANASLFVVLLSMCWLSRFLILADRDRGTSKNLPPRDNYVIISP